MECSSTQQKPWNPQKHGRFASNDFPLRSELFQVSAIRFFECRTTPNVIKVQVDLFVWNLPSCRLLFVVLLCLLVSSFVCLFVFGWFVLHHQGSTHRSWYRRTCQPWGWFRIRNFHLLASAFQTSAGCCNTMVLIVMRQTGTSWKCSSTNVAIQIHACKMPRLNITLIFFIILNPIYLLGGFRTYRSSSMFSTWTPVKNIVKMDHFPKLRGKNASPKPTGPSWLSEECTNQKPYM